VAPPRARRRWIALVVALLGAFQAARPADAAQSERGRIEGRLLRPSGSGVAGATIVVDQNVAGGFTDNEGRFFVNSLTPGPHSVTLTLQTEAVTIQRVQVTAGGTTTVEQTVDWEDLAGFTEHLTVIGASRRPEPLVEAAAAATLITGPDLDRNAAAGQLAALVAFAPGATVTQGGLWDFNMGTRGFNRTLSRRVAVLADGRDLSLPFFGYQGWPAFSFPLDDLSSVELVRGPSAALYGANASGGVISITSKEPRFSPGGMVRVAVGERDSLNFDGRWAGQTGKRSYARVLGGVRRSRGYAVSRVGGAEYSTTCAAGAFGDCLPAEIVPINGEDSEIYFGSIRVDRYFESGRRVTAEAGHAQGSFGIFQATGQRTKSTARDGKRPWARFVFSDPGYEASVSYDGYYEPSGYLGLTTGTRFTSSSYRLQTEGRGNRSMRNGRVQLMAGAAATLERMNSFDPRTNGQSFLFAPVRSDAQALFGLGSWDITDRLRVVLAARGDWSSLHDAQLSPRGSVLYRLGQDHRVRVTYNRAFQVSNSLEYFLKAPVSAPADLSALNAFCSPFGVDCRFGSTPIVAVGHEDMDVERVRTVELGYKGLIAQRTFVTVEYYRSRSTGLVTSLLPQVGTPLGRLNPRFGPWRAPAGLPDVFAEQIRSLVPALSNDADGSNIIAAASYANFGRVTVNGLDAGVSHGFGGGWRSEFGFSWFDFESHDANATGLLLPNTPPRAVSAGVKYDRQRIGAAFDVRWVHGFRWADGFFIGDVPTFTTASLTATYPLTDRASVGLSVSNLFDDRHWETFGGALITRRALVSVDYRW
jgi:outer membrane receptor protein involved in Fe transport